MQPNESAGVAGDVITYTLPEPEYTIVVQPTLRDQFAAAALCGMLSRSPYERAEAAVNAYMVADAMLKAREVKP